MLIIYDSDVATVLVANQDDQRTMEKILVIFVVETIALV